MQNQFLYSGRGNLLRQVAAATGNAAVDPTVTDIEAGEFTELFGAHDCLEFLFEFTFIDTNGDPAAATGDIIIEKVPDQNAATAGEEFDTLSVAAQYSANWNAGEALLGFFRVQNDTNQSVRVRLEKRIL